MHSDNVGRQFSSEDRVAQMRAAKSRPGTEVYFGHPNGRYVPNPMGTHLTKDEPVGSYYRKNATVEARGVLKSIPVDRLESSQPEIDRKHVTAMAKRKGTPPPIEVTHHVDHDRYFVSDGNHRALAAMLKGETHVRAEVTRIRGWD